MTAQGMAGFIMVAMTSVLGIACKKTAESYGKNASPLGIPAPDKADLKLRYTGALYVSMPCKEGEVLKLTQPVKELHCVAKIFADQLDLFKNQPTDVINAVEGDVHSKDGTTVHVTASLELNETTLPFMARLDAAGTVTPGLVLDAPLQGKDYSAVSVTGGATLENGIVRARISVAAGITVQLGGKEIALTTQGTVSRGVVSVPWNNRPMTESRSFSNGATVLFQQTFDTIPMVLTPASGTPIHTVLRPVLGFAGLVSAQSVTHPFWFVDTSKPAAKVGILVRTNGKYTYTDGVGEGPLSQLGVVALAEPGETRRFAPCRYAGGYSVERSAQSMKITAYDPRTGQMLGGKLIEARAPKCDRSIQVRATDNAVFGSGNEVEMKEMADWMLSLVH